MYMYITYFLFLFLGRTAVERQSEKCGYKRIAAVSDVRRYMDDAAFFRNSTSYLFLLYCFLLETLDSTVLHVVKHLTSTKLSFSI